MAEGLTVNDGIHEAQTLQNRAAKKASNNEWGDDTGKKWLIKYAQFRWSDNYRKVANA